jgi:hypothetical protein
VQAFRIYKVGFRPVVWAQVSINLFHKILEKSVSLQHEVHWNLA